MPLFEFDAGQLIPAQVGHAVTDPVEPAVLDAVRAQVLELLRLPVLPVTWQDDDGAPRLTAMDPAGHVVSIEVLERLDATSLVAALGRAGSSGARGWIEVARSYPSGVGAFRRDWNAFREAQPVGTTSAARVHVVATHIDDDARQALDALAGAGVVVHELAVREMSSGRLFLDVTEVNVPVAPLPWLLPGRAPATLEQVPDLGEPAGIASTQPSDEPARAETDPGEPDVVTAGPEVAAAEPGEPDVVTAGPGVAAVEPDEPDVVTAGPEVAAVEPGEPDVVTAAPDAAVAASPDEDLQRISASLSAPTPLLWVDNGRRREATLLPEGWIVVGDEPFAAPETAARAVAGNQAAADPWSAWRFGEHGPSLHEAREELRAHRSRRHRRAAQTGPGLRRRERRRRAASE